MKTVIELLKQSRELINHSISKFPMGETELYEAEKLRDKIDEFLAKPAPDAMEMVRHIEEILESANYDCSERLMEKARGEAAALIEAYGRRVPRAMLEEVFDNGYQSGDEFGAYEDIDQERKNFDAIAAKYGVKIEEV